MILFQNYPKKQNDMKRSLKNIKDYSIECLDGIKGNIKDLLFDEDSWIIRYIEADFKDQDFGSRVLIPRFHLNKPDWENRTFHLNLDKPEIKASPTLEEATPVSREFEKRLAEHYNIEPYWPYIPAVPAGNYYPTRPLQVPTKEIHEEDLDTSLRSFEEVRTYRIHGTDGHMGQVEDIIVDDRDWQIIYLIVDTSIWLPWSKKVVLSIDWLTKISYVHKHVSIELNKEQIKNAPEFDPSHPIDMDYEKALDAYFKDQIIHTTS